MLGTRSGTRRILAGLPVGLVALLVLAGTALAATVALWHMEDPSNLVDSSGNGNNGTPSNVTSAPGYSGNGYGFNGKNSVATVPSSDSLNPGSSDITFTVHANLVTAPGKGKDYDVLRKGLGKTSGGDYKMEILHSGQASCLFGNGGRHGKDYSISGGPNLADGAWHTISCAKTASNIQLTVDGTTYTKNATVGPITNSAPLTIGAKGPQGGDPYLGTLDEITVDIGSSTQPAATSKLSPQAAASSPQSGDAQPPANLQNSSLPPSKQDSSPQPEQDDSSLKEQDAPPSSKQDSSPQPKQDDSSLTGQDSSPPPSKQDSSAPPPEQDSSAPPPKQDSSPPPPKQDSSAPPPKQDSTSSPKQDDSSHPSRSH